VEIKRKQLKQAVLLRQANHQALKQLLLAKKARLRSPQVQLHLKRPRRLLINLQQLQRHHKRHQNKDKVKKWLINRQLVNKLLLRLLQLNKLLKLVEEPPERTIILMVTMDEPSVLQTLRSRMQTLRLRPLTEPEIETALRATPTDYAEADALYAAHLSEGNYRKALDLYEGRAAELGEEYALLQRILRATVNAQPREMKLLAEDLAALSKEEQASLLEYLARMFREFYLYNLSLPDINYLTSREEGIARYLRSCITGRNVRQVEAEIDEAARHLAQNVQAKMVFFDLILRLTSTLAPSYKQVGVR